MDMPIIRLEVEGMKASILHAFMDYQLQLDCTLKSSVEAFCAPENVERIVNEAVRTTLKKAIEEQIETFFRYGKGNIVLREAVNKKLSEVCDIQT